jgi:signal transduction histidine kinase
VFTKLIEYFIPDEVRHISINEYFRGRTLVISSMIASVFVAGFTLSRGVLEGFLLMPAMVLGSCTLFTLATPFIFRATRSVNLAGKFLTFSATAVLIFFSFLDGGYGSTSLLWFPVLPVFAMFFGGLRYGILITVFLISDLLFLVYAHTIDLVPPNLFAGETVIYYLYLASLSGVIVVLVALATLYLSWQRAVQENLLKASRAKDEFLSGMSHELRTPLNAILGFSEVLEREYSGELNDKQHEQVEKIRRGSAHMLELVNGLLDSARIEAGEMDFSPSAVNLEEALAACLQMVEPDVRKKRINMQIEPVDVSRTTEVMLDEIKFRQIILNLLSNALKFSPEESTVKLEYTVDNETLRVSVSDQGPGIPEEYRERVFDRFFKIENQDNITPGTGLGLAICQFFAELHGGQIFTKAAGQYNQFVLELPLREVS